MSPKLHRRSSPTTQTTVRTVSTTPALNAPHGRRTDGLRVHSDLTDHEPVSDAEIRLVLSALGDMLFDILNPATKPCPAATKASEE
jgi:hypothetical protein